ncbi:MAG: bacteriophage holin [Patescibacteria group bacterium]|nr:bacteriophage holin [Patescibacteria group bacterium]
MNLNKAALTGGIVWGGCLFVTTLASVYFGYATAFLQAFGSIYPGYSITLTGSVVGLIYGFLDAFVGVYIIAWVYKMLSK